MSTSWESSTNIYDVSDFELCLWWLAYETMRMTFETMPVESIGIEYQDLFFAARSMLNPVPSPVGIPSFSPLQLHTIQRLGPIYSTQFHFSNQHVSYSTNTADLTQTLTSPTPPAHSNAAQTHTPPPSSTIPSAQRSHRNRPLCSHCGRTHTRPVRYRACRDKSLNHQPFACGGECGKPTCAQTFASSERKNAHVRGRGNCKICGEPGWKKNQTRHRAKCRPNSP